MRKLFILLFAALFSLTVSAQMVDMDYGSAYHAYYCTYPIEFDYGEGSAYGVMLYNPKECIYYTFIFCTKEEAYGLGLLYKQAVKMLNDTNYISELDEASESIAELVNTIVEQSYYVDCRLIDIDADTVMVRDYFFIGEQDESTL